MKRVISFNGFTAIVSMIAALGIFLFGGCSTVTQAPVKSQSASWDGNAQNSGILAKVPAGYIVTPTFRARYNSLITIYGRSKTKDGSPIFTPPLAVDSGITPVPPSVASQTYNQPQVWLINNQGMAAMVILSDLKRRGFAP